MASRIHHCISQEMVSQGIEEPPAKNCRCRKFIGIAEATELVKNGSARWVVTKRARGLDKAVCSICGGDAEVKKCAGCGGLGTVVVPVVIDSYNNDIVLVSRASIDKKEKKYRPALALKTPRVATIEEEHIQRAYVLGVKEAEERIEDYGNLIQFSLQELGAELARVTRKFKKESHQFEISRKILVEGHLEPANNQSKGEGRDYDWGRTI